MEGDPTRKLLRDYGIAIVAAIVIALVIRFFVIEAYRIPSHSMRPLLEPGDIIFVAKWPYGLRLPMFDNPLTKGRPPQRGEVVVFSLPGEPGRDYIKRVIAIAGDTVRIKNGRVSVNSMELTLPSKRDDVCGKERVYSETPGAPAASEYEVCWEPPISENFGPEKVPADSVFVLGDLRTQPSERKSTKPWGIIPRSAIKAKGLWIWLSVDPPAQGSQSGLFSRIKFERMFKEIH